MKGLLQLAVCATCMGATPVLGQWELPERVVLNGGSEQDRRVSGLAAPDQADAGTSATAARDLATTFTVVTGATVLSADPVPAIIAPVVGMVLTIVPIESHGPSPYLALNATGPFPLMDRAGDPLDSAAMPPGAPARLVFDGNAFILLNTRTVDCPSGYLPLSAGQCMEAEPRAAVDFVTASTTCAAEQARLCRFGEWSVGCDRFGWTFSDNSAAEWVDSGANDADDAKVMGAGSLGYQGITGVGCRYGASRPMSNTALFRCCRDR